MSEAVPPQEIKRMEDDPFEREDQDLLAGISTNVFSYITPSMIFLMLVVIFIILLAIDTLIINVKTNIPLNSAIITLALYSIARTFGISYMIYRTADYVREVEEVIQMEEIDEEAVDKLKEDLESKGGLLNMANMWKCVDNIAQYGHMNVTDKDAMLIKSKMGARMRYYRGNVGFIAGILVMMGLLGTFMGLLKTIDAVGEAMASMSNIGGGDGLGDISGFIGKLAEPLQGMGLAFSSSLFGLSGSLLIGFFNHLSGAGQNQFIEGFSRWIDDHIPKPGKALKKGAAGPKVPHADDLKAWLAGFVMMSTKTNHKLGMLLTSLAQTAEAARVSAHNTQEVAKQHYQMTDALEKINQTLEQIKTQDLQNSQRMDEYNQEFRVTLEKFNDNTNTFLDAAKSLTINQNTVQEKVDSYGEGIRSALYQLTADSKAILENTRSLSTRETDMTNDVKDVSQRITAYLDDSSVKMRAFANTLSTISDTNKNYAQQSQELKSVVYQLNNVQLSLTREIKALNENMMAGESIGSISDMVLSLTNIIDEINSKNIEHFGNIFVGADKDELSMDSATSIKKGAVPTTSGPNFIKPGGSATIKPTEKPEDKKEASNDPAKENKDDKKEQDKKNDDK